MNAQQVIFTYDDYLTLPNDGKRYEIIEGELYMTASPFYAHQRASHELDYLLTDFVKKHDLGEVLTAPFDVVLSMTDVVEPDILFVSKQRLHIITKKNIIAAPDLIIEIISESTAKVDRVQKKALYEKYGVKEYWIVDGEQQSIERFNWKEGSFTQGVVTRAGEIFESQLLKGFSFTVSKIFT
jgi:Uma2 family endonuclease